MESERLPPLADRPPWPADVAHVVNVSGGKDSTATYLAAMEVLGPDGFEPVFADTGWEHRSTYDYLARLPAVTGGPEVRTIRMPTPTERLERRGLASTGNTFKDLVAANGLFPGPVRRFCTSDMKVKPLERQVYRPLIEAGRNVVSWQGVRADESHARRELPTWQVVMARKGWGDLAVHAYRPLLHWTTEHVFAAHKRAGIEPNPLYAQGLSRVGCWPCVFARKSEIRTIARLDPDRIAEIREWEQRQARETGRIDSTFFSARTLPVIRRARNPQVDHREHGIDAVVDWAHDRNAEQPELDPDGWEELYRTDCIEWGACET